MDWAHTWDTQEFRVKVPYWGGKENKNFSHHHGHWRKQCSDTQRVQAPLYVMCKYDAITQSINFKTSCFNATIGPRKKKNIGCTHFQKNHATNLIRKIRIILMFLRVSLTLSSYLFKTEFYNNCNDHSFVAQTFWNCLLTSYNTVCLVLIISRIHLKDYSFNKLWNYTFLCDFRKPKESMLWNSLWM